MKIKVFSYITLLLHCVVISFLICGCSENTNDLADNFQAQNEMIEVDEFSVSVEKDVEDNIQIDTDSYNTGNSLYEDILNKISMAIVNEDDSETVDYSYVYGRFGKFENSSFGYALIDINNDGIDELVVGENGTDQYPSILYDMYIMKNENIVHLFSGGERDRYYATDIANVFYEEGSSSAEVSFYEIYAIEDGKLMSAEFVIPPNKVNLLLNEFKIK